MPHREYGAAAANFVGELELALGGPELAAAEGKPLPPTAPRIRLTAMTTPNDLRRRFHELHKSGCFVIPNPWDVGSARLLQQLGFKALATTSSGFAWTQGRADNHVTLEAVLAHLRAMSAAVTIPLNADFEGGFAVKPNDVAVNVTAATATGISGLSIEDSTGDPANPLFDFSLAVERIAAA